MNKEPILDNDDEISDIEFDLADDLEDDLLSEEKVGSKTQTARQRIEDLMDLKRLRELDDSIELDDLLH
jgi:hypothetical protein